MGRVKVACLVLMCMAMVGAPITQAISCAQVTTYTAPCIGYLKSGGAVPGGCCKGVKDLFTKYGTLVDKQTICNCLSSDVTTIKGFKNKNAKSLPGKCGLKIPYKISTSMNCRNIQF